MTSFDLYTLIVITISLASLIGGGVLLFGGIKRLWKNRSVKGGREWVKLLLGLFFVLFPFIYNYASLYPYPSSIWSCYKDEFYLENYKETDKAQQMTHKWTQEVENFITSNDEFRHEGALIAHVKYADRQNASPIRVWRVGPDQKLSSVSIDYFQSVFYGEPSPKNPNTIYRFTLTDVSENRVCVFVQASSGHRLKKGGIGSSGELWLLLNKKGQWIKNEDEGTVFNSQ